MGRPVTRTRSYITQNPWYGSASDQDFVPVAIVVDRAGDTNPGRDKPHLSSSGGHFWERSATQLLGPMLPCITLGLLNFTYRRNVLEALDGTETGRVTGGWGGHVFWDTYNVSDLFYRPLQYYILVTAQTRIHPPVWIRRPQSHWGVTCSHWGVTCYISDWILQPRYRC